jgi:putative ABC transport system permease protein
MTQGLTLLIRSILVGRFYSLISVLGLAIAVAAVILVSALLAHEYAYEDSYSDSDRTYRLNWISSSTGDRFATMFNPFSEQLAGDAAEVELATRVGTFEVLLDRADGPAVQGVSGFELVGFADPTFFGVFDLSFVSGDGESALALPGSLVLTESAAEKYFPGETAVGQTIMLENDTTLTVTAIIEDMPASTHLPFHFIAPLETLRNIFDGAGWLDSWGSDQLYHYLRLAPGVDVNSAHARIMDFAERHVPYEGWDFQIALQPLGEIHFSPDLQNEMPTQDSILNIGKTPRAKSDLVLFSAGALILVLIASFNFMNLQIARGFGRSKQLGLLKVVGASRLKVFERLLSESVLFAVMALIVALMIVELSLGLFGQTIGVSLNWSDVMQPKVIAAVVVTTLVLGLLSGIYPAWLMASQKPGLILKGEFSHGHGVNRIRQALVLLQFTVSIVLVVVSLGIYAQIKYSISAPLGFEPAQTAVVSIGRPEVRGDYETLRIRILEHPDVSLVSRGTIIPTGNLSDGTTLDPDGGGPIEPVGVRLVTVEFDFLEALGVNMVAGRSFSQDFAADEFTFPDAENPTTHAGIIINEAAALRAGWSNPSDALGKEMRNDFESNGAAVTIIMSIIGVVEDVHYRSLRSEVVPMAFFMMKRGGNLIVKVNGNNTESVMTHIQTVWQETVPEIPLQLEWMDDAVEKLYEQETRILSLMSGVSIIAIGVACLGLFAVASLVTQFRRREVALRKVFGAKLTQIINLLSWRFLKSVLLANLLAWPIAWLYMNSWLGNFAYRIELSLSQFLIPAVMTFVIAYLTVACQAWIVARNAPVHALRYE